MKTVFPRSFPRWFAAVMVLFWLARPGLAAAQDFAGVWNIRGTLLTDSGNGNDPYAPKAGAQKPDRWSIAADGNTLTLTSAAGSIAGIQTVPGSARFMGRYPMPVGKFTGIMQITIDCKLVASGQLVAAEEILYFMPNGLGVIQPMPLGREAWKIEGAR